MFKGVFKFLLFVFFLNATVLAVYIAYKEYKIRSTVLPLQRELSDVESKIRFINEKMGKFRSNVIVLPREISFLKKAFDDAGIRIGRMKVIRKVEDKKGSSYYYVRIFFDGSDLKKSILLYLVTASHPLTYKIPEIYKGRMDVIFFEPAKKERWNNKKERGT